MRIRIHRLLADTKVAGPGNRFCIWVQGCSRHCPGCMARDTWSFSGGAWMDTEEVWRAVAADKGAEGVTFLGGEPFEQPAAVADVAERAKARGLSVVMFTGFTHEELAESVDPAVKRCLTATDLLIDGPFIEAQFDLRRPWVGSKNQRYIFLTDRHRSADIEGIDNTVEIRISPDGTALVNGMGDFEAIKRLL